VSQLEILAGRINALLNVLGILAIFVGVVLWLGCVLMAIDAARHGDWTILLALVFFVGCLLLGSILEPLIPYGRTRGSKHNGPKTSVKRCHGLFR